MNSGLILRNFFLSLASTNFDELFYDANSGSNIPFKNVFPPGSYSIVGNSPISLEQKNGMNINKSNYVVRFNNFQVQNYEYNVGTKTDIWITGGGVQAPNYVPNVSGMKKVLVMNNNKTFKDKQLKIIEKYKAESLSSFIIFHNDAFLNKITTLLQGVPTTGFIILLMMAAKYKNINTFGFSFGAYKNKYHYYNDYVSQDYGHKWSKEFEVFKVLVSKKLLVNKDILTQSPQQNNYNSFYNRNMPKHVKRLYKQRTAQRIPGNRFIKQTKRQTVLRTQVGLRPQQFQNAPTQGVTYNNNNQESRVANDTNNKLQQINQFLSNI